MKNAISRDSLNSLVQKVTELWKELIDIDKKQFDNKKRKLYEYIHYPSISHSGISVTLIDEGSVKLYDFISQYDALFFDASASFVSPLPWLRNEKGEKKIILLYALTAGLPSGGSPPIAILEHITSEHNAFSIRQPLMKLEEMEQKKFGKRNCGPKVVIVDYSKAMIKAVSHEFFGESLYQYLDRAYRIIHGDSKTDDFSRTFIHVCTYHVLQMGRRKIKEILKSSKSNSQQILGRLICYTDLEEVKRFLKNIYIVLTTERSSNLVEYYVQTIEEKINNFDYAEADLIALNADEDEKILYNGQPAENEIEDEEDFVNKSTVLNLWEYYWN